MFHLGQISKIIYRLRLHFNVNWGSLDQYGNFRPGILFTLFLSYFPGSIITGLHYKKVQSLYGCTPITCLVGQLHTGKTHVAKFITSLFGLHNTGKYDAFTAPKVDRLLAHCLYFLYDDPDNVPVLKTLITKVRDSTSLKVHFCPDSHYTCQAHHLYSYVYKSFSSVNQQKTYRTLLNHYTVLHVYIIFSSVNQQKTYSTLMNHYTVLHVYIIFISVNQQKTYRTLLNHYTVLHVYIIFISVNQQKTYRT